MGSATTGATIAEDPGISSSFPALRNQRIDNRSAGIGARDLDTEKRLGRHGAAQSHDTVSQQPRQANHP
jgi:hypothetical protein